MYIVVVLLGLVSLVVCFLLMVVLVLVQQTGTMAPPYHLNLWYYFYQSNNTNYTFRGGHSGYGFYCGVFCVYLNGVSGIARWTLGAALSFKLSIYKSYEYYICYSWWFIVLWSPFWRFLCWPGQFVF